MQPSPKGHIRFWPTAIYVSLCFGPVSGENIVSGKTQADGSSSWTPPALNSLFLLGTKSSPLSNHPYSSLQLGAHRSNSTNPQSGQHWNPLVLTTLIQQPSSNASVLELCLAEPGQELFTLHLSTGRWCPLVATMLRKAFPTERETLSIATLFPTACSSLESKTRRTASKLISQ